MPVDTQSSTRETVSARRRDEITFFDLFLILHRRRRLLFGIIASGVAAGLLLALLTPSSYQATTAIVPSAALAPATEFGLSDFRAAASQFGINLGSNQSNPSVLFPEFLGARDLQRRVLERSYQGRGGRSVNLVSELDLQGSSPEATLENAARFFGAGLRTSYDFKTGVTRVSLTLRDPVLAAGVLNAFIEEMDVFVHLLRSRQAGQKVRFVGQRLEEVQDQLGQAETRLADFRLRNRIISGAPQLQLEEGRLLRDFRVSEEVFLTLKTQLEIARIEEFQSLPDVIVLERAEPPARRSAPYRAKTVVMATLASGFFGLVAVFALEVVRTWMRRMYGLMPG